MIIKNSLDEVKKRESALKAINSIINKEGRNSLFDLTGLSGGFLAKQEDLNLLETYVGPAIFEEKLQELGIAHLSGEKVFPVNRTSSGILASILAIVKENSYVVHFLPEFPAHPSIPRSCKLIKGVNYLEFDNIEEFFIHDDTSLVVITGSTMDHKILDETEFKKIIDLAHLNDIPVLVDDASGARLRTAIYNQKKAIELGADLVVTSTDKLMLGPRGGLMSGKRELMDKIIDKAHQFGLEAQPPSVLAMVKGLEVYDENDLKNSILKKEELINIIKNSSDIFDELFEETPTGVMVSEESFKIAIDKNKINTNFSPKDICFLWSMILLKNEKIITIPAVSMPGASGTVRFDLAANDAKNLEIAILIEKINNSFNSLLKIVNNNSNRNSSSSSSNNNKNNEEIAKEKEIAKEILFS
ncbi:MAG: TIGR03576 family pyridoxal phosphate-dependent enzyme [Methanobrevibacter sp.]|jgi:L-seryl-tRNA(Ser) seleniumtransferase|nr:TIGR03576 family pyridoxal phosphate-dependent enzyme [Methanobrevibacter sp.]